MHHEQPTRPTLALAVREALAVLHPDARPRDVARYLRTNYPRVTWTTKSLQTTISTQREELRAVHDASVPQLIALASQLTQRGKSAADMLAQAREVAALAGFVGGIRQLFDCLGLLTGLAGLRNQVDAEGETEDDDLEAIA